MTDGDASRETRAPRPLGPGSCVPPAVRRYPPPIVAALTILTLIFLSTQLAAGVRQSDRLYPVTGYPMFSHESRGLNVDLVLEGVTVDGATVSVHPEELGLTELQLRRNLAHEVLGVSPDRASNRLEQIASIWCEREQRELAELSLWRVERWVDGRQIPPEQVAMWAR